MHNKKPVLYIGLAILWTALAITQFGKSVRAVELIGLFGSGLAAGAFTAIAIFMLSRKR